jgi:hypothetical protein
MAHDEDILETALNSSIAYSAKYHQVSTEKVVSVVTAFKQDIEDDDLCDCERARKSGYAQMCFSCTGPDRQRINLNQ